MLQKEIDDVVAMLTKELGVACYYDRNDFVLFRQRDCNVYRQLIIKEKSPWVLLYGSEYKRARALIGQLLNELVSPGWELDVDDSVPVNGDAVWCRLKYDCGRGWYERRKDIVLMAAKVHKVLNDNGVLGSAGDFLKWLDGVASASSKKESVCRSVQVAIPGKGVVENSDTNDLPVWRGWDEYREYWDGFVSEWYACKERAEQRGGSVEEAACVLPSDKLTSALAKHELFASGLIAHDGQLNREELPEPYLGNPKDAQFVIIQMNPGASETECNDSAFSLEATKYYSRKHCTGANGFLIKDFSDAFTCQRLYSKWIERWSSAKCQYPSFVGVANFPGGVRPDLVCGHDWWWERGRVEWIRRFAGCGVEKVFDIELMPYHSRNFDLKGFGKKNAEERKYILERVILPAGIACSQNGLDYVVGRGAILKNFFEKNLNAKVIASWENGVYVGPDGTCQKMENWPLNNKGKPKTWHYKLYEYPVKTIEQGETVLRNVRFLITWVQAIGMNCPGPEMAIVEEMIKSQIKRF